MRTININKVTYTLVCHTKKGIVVKVTMNGSTSQIFFWNSWRIFKRYIA